MGEQATIGPDAAYELHTTVLHHNGARRATWVPLAQALHAFHENRAWSELGYERLADWLGDPDVSLGRSEYYTMVRAWSAQQEHEIPVARLAQIDLSKIAVVLPILLADAESVDHALADCETLSRSDLRAKYQHPRHAQYRVCEACGSRVKGDAETGE